MALSKNEMGWPHPDLNALAALVDQRLSEADRAGVIAHLASCVECRAIVATEARGLGGAARQRESPAGRRFRWGFRSTPWLPIAATLALATTAGLIVWRIDRGSPPPASSVTAVPGPAPSNPETPVAAAPGAQTSPRLPAPAVTPRPAPSDSLATRRNAVRLVNGKTFRLVAGEWIDAEYDPVALLPVRDIVGPDARIGLLERIPALAQYAALGPRVTVAHDGVVYRFQP